MYKSTSILVSTIPFVFGIGSFYFPNPLGQLSSNAVYMVASILVLITVLNIFATGKIYFAQINYVAWISWGILASFLYNINHDIYVEKFSNLTILYMIYLSPLLFFRRIYDLVLIRSSQRVLLINYFLILSILVYGSNWQDAVGQFFTIVTTNDPRPRGFFSEVSRYGMYIIWLIFLSTIDMKYLRATKNIFNFLIVISLQSKGAILAMLPFLAFIKFSFLKSILTFIILLFLLFYILSAVSFDFENFMSTSTRVFLMLCSIEILFSHPLGVGFGGFEDVLISKSNNPSTLAAPFFTPEIDLTISQGIAVSSKSAIFDLLIIFGLPFLGAMLFIAYRSIVKGYLLRFIVLVLLLGFTDGYAIFAVLLALQLILNKKEVS